MRTPGQDDRAECRRKLAAYLAADDWPEPAPPPPAGEPCPVGTAADLDMRPAPDPHNGGITPGYRPDPEPGAVDPAEIGGLRAATARLTVDVGRLKGETWELAGEVLSLRRQIDGGGNGGPGTESGGRRPAARRPDA